MPTYDLLATAPLTPIQEARSSDDLDAVAAQLRRSDGWREDGRPISEVRGEVDPAFAHHAEHYGRMMAGGVRPDGSAYPGGGGLRSVRMVVEDGTAEVVIAGSREWRPGAHSYLTRIRFANFGLVSRAPSLTWTERARLLMRDDVRVHCSCPAFAYYHAHAATEKGFALVDEDRGAPVRNPDDRGGVCKHLDHALRYVAANYTTIAGAMKRHRQTEESAVTIEREPPVQAQDVIERLDAVLRVSAPVCEAAQLTTTEVHKVRVKDGNAYKFYTSAASGHTETFAMLDGHMPPSGLDLPVKEKVYGTDNRWGERTVASKSFAGNLRQVPDGHGGTRVTSGVGEKAQDLHPAMADAFHAARAKDPELQAHYEKAVADVGRPAYGPHFWHHPTVQKFLREYDPAKIADNPHGVVDVPTSRGLKGLGHKLKGMGFDGTSAGMAHAAAVIALHKHIKTPGLGSKDIHVGTPEDAHVDAGPESSPNAGRRDPNWDREDFGSWERSKAFVKSGVGAAMLVGNAVKNKEGDAAKAITDGIRSKPPQYWKDMIYGAPKAKTMTRQRAADVYGKDAEGNKVLVGMDIHDAPVRPKDSDFAPEHDKNTADPYHAQRQAWIKQNVAYRAKAKAAKVSTAAAKDAAPVHTMDLSAFADAPAKAAEPSSSYSAAPAKAPKPPKSRPGLGDLSAFGGAKAAPVASAPAPASASTLVRMRDMGGITAQKAHANADEEIGRIHADMLKQHSDAVQKKWNEWGHKAEGHDWLTWLGGMPKPTRDDAADEYVSRKAAKRGIKVTETVARLSGMCEGVSQDLVASISAAMERASKMGAARTAQALRLAMASASVEGGSKPPSSTPADPRGMPQDQP